MICAILIGRKGSKGFPGKNLKKINGKRMCEYPLLAAKRTKSIEKIFVSTDCPIIKKISKKYNATILERPFQNSRIIFF
jgi:CMP-N-acetylneuraminic acid synthetase